MAQYKKYKYYKKQVYSGGTWIDVTPLTLTLSGESYGTYITLDDCLDSIVPTEHFKLKLVPPAGIPYKLECDSSTTLTDSEVRDDFEEKGIYYSDYITASGYVGNCVETISGSSFIGFNFPDCEYYKINDSVSAITSSSFKANTHLKEIDLPSGLTSIAYSTFSGCTSLEKAVIPSGVTSIGHSAYELCTSLSSVTIPYACTSIEYNAFKGCSSLSGVNLTNDSTEIMYYAFSGCSSLTTAIIHASTIGMGAFADCSSLSSVTFSSGVTSIDIDAFSGCTSLINVDIPSSCTSIGNRAFYGCTSLSSATMNPQIIGYDAFKNCSGLTNVVIGNNCTSIGSGSFSGCSALSSVYVYATTPPTLTSGAFGPGDYYQGAYTNMKIYVPCSSIYDYKAASGWTDYSQRIYPIENDCNTNNLKMVITKNGFRDKYLICDNSTINYSDADYIRNSTINADYGVVINVVSGSPYFSAGTCVTSIGNNAFSGCTKLTYVDISGNSVTSIGDYAFYGCTSFSANSSDNAFEIPSSITTIGTGAFKGSGIKGKYYTTEYNSEYSGMTGLLIPSGVTSIGAEAFSGCTNLRNVIIADRTVGYPMIPSLANANAFSGISKIYVPCAKYSYYMADNVWSQLPILPYTNSTNCNRAIVELWGTNKVIPCSLSSTTLNRAVMNEYGCNPGVYVSGITIGNCTTTIEDTIVNSDYLYNLTIPSGVTSIGDYAFVCSGMNTVTMNSLTPPVLGNNPFSSPWRIYVPCEAYNDYRNASTWSQYLSKLHPYGDCPQPTGYKAMLQDATGNTVNVDCDFTNSAITQSEVTSAMTPTDIVSVVFGDCVTSIGYSAFSGCSSITSITISDNITDIGNYAFRNCSGMTSVTIGSGVTSIGSNAFGFCSGMTNIIIGNSVTSINNAAFQYCNGLSNITIPSAVTRIGDMAFQYCSGLTSVTIGSGITSIGRITFRYCSGLTSVTVNADNPPSLGSSALDNTPIASGTGYIYVPSSSVNSYKTASGWSNYANQILAIP